LLKKKIENTIVYQESQVKI